MSKKSTTLKIALLSLSLLTILTGGPIAPVLGEVTKEFPDATPTQVQMVLTLPSIFIMVVSLITGQLAMRIRKRTLLFAGLTFFFVGGLSGLVAPTLQTLLITRAIMGIGVGIIAPLATSLITDFYTGDERAQMVGYSQSARTLTGIMVGPIVGLIAYQNWRNVFWMYGLGVIILFVAIFFIPQTPVILNDEKKVGSFNKRLPKAVWAFAFFMFLQRLSFFVVPSNIAVYAQNNGWGGAELSGWAISAITFASFVVGIFFAQIYKRLHRWMGMISIAFLAIGYLGILASNGPFGLMLSMLSLGIAEGFLFPLLLYQTAQACTTETRTMGIALVNSMRFFSQFVTPYVFAGLGFIFKTHEIGDYFLIDAGLVMAVILMGTIFLLVKGKPAANMAVNE